MKILLAILLLASYSQAAFAINCGETPNDCQTCNELLDGCDLPATGYDSSTSTTNRSNPCYIYCHYGYEDDD